MDKPRGDPIQHILQSGSPRVLNAYRIAEDLKKEGRPDDVLFKTPAMNRCVLFKELHLGGEVEGVKRVRVGTKIYVPFDIDHAENGGMTVFFSKYTFLNSMSGLVDLGDAKRKTDLTTDMQIIERLDTIPTFAPFLVRDCFDRATIKADAAYSHIPPEEWDAIQAFVRSRFEQMLGAVTGSGNKEALDRLVDKLWDLSDKPALQSLATAFGLNPEDYLDTFYSWKGILYFSWAFSEVRDEIYEVMQWLDNKVELVTVVPPNLVASAKQDFVSARAGVATLLNQVEHALTEYEHSFNELFVHGTGPSRFIRFLSHANDHFSLCGASLGILQHVYEFWNRSTVAFPNRKPPAEILLKMLETLQDIAITKDT